VKGTKNPAKGEAYECGIPSQGSPWNQFNIGYYLFALIFLIFDVELIFLYPWAVVVKANWFSSIRGNNNLSFYSFHGILICAQKGSIEMDVTSPLSIPIQGGREGR
jgi:NADH-quinone oxidoreductase subunit A